MTEHHQLKKLEVEIYYTAEMDEFWSFACTLRSTRVGKKSNQRWTWYAMDKASGIILAWHNGGRTDADFGQLQKYLENIPIDLYYTDDWGAYTRNLPASRHYTCTVSKHTYRQRSDLEDRKKEPQFQNTSQTTEQKNNLLFKKRRDT